VSCPGDGAIIFSDLIRKLDLLRVRCDKCGRDGCYELIDKLAATARSSISWIKSPPTSRRGQRTIWVTGGSTVPGF